MCLWLYGWRRIFCGVILMGDRYKEINNDFGHEDKNVFMSPAFVGALIVISIGIFILSRVNFLFSHIILEGWTIMVGFLIYILSVRTYRYSKDNCLFFLGHAYFAVAFIDIFHTLAYEGMNIFPHSGSDLATQLWISARYIEAGALLIVPFFYSRKIGRLGLTLIFGTITLVILGAIFKWEIFPSCYDASSGLTAFKIVSEYMISTMLLIGFLIIIKKKDILGSSSVMNALLLAILFTIASELSFTLYRDVYGFMNVLGHIFKLLSFYVIYEGVIMSGLEEPFSHIFTKLKKASMKDPLTGLYNRMGLMELSERMMARVAREGSSIGCVVIDLDNFKSINDRFGHSIGDHVIQQTGLILLKTCRKSDIIARTGGDEFLILAPIDRKGLDSLRKRICLEFNNWFSDTSFAEILDISVGSVFKEYVSLSDLTVDKLIMEADFEMYRHKESKKEIKEQAEMPCPGAIRAVTA